MQIVFKIDFTISKYIQKYNVYKESFAPTVCFHNHPLMRPPQTTSSNNSYSNI